MKPYKKKLPKWEYVKRRHGKAYRTRMRNLKEARKQRGFEN